MNNDLQKKLGIVLQYLQMGLNIIISFVYTPIMLNILGKAEYGIYNIANSIISYLSLLSLGFGASYIRFYSGYKNKCDEKGIERLNGLFMITFILIGMVAFLCGLFLSENVSLFFNDTYSTRDKEIAHILMVFMAFNLALTFPGSVFTSYISAQEKFVFQKIMGMISTVAGPFLTLPVLLMGWGSVGMIVVTTLIGIIVMLINIKFCISTLKMRFCFKHLDFKMLKDIARFSIFIAINQMIDQINWSTDKIILGKLCSSSAVTVYAIGAQLNTYFTNFSTAISSVFVPQIHRIESGYTDEDEKNRVHTMLFVKVGRLQFMVLILILTGFIFFGKFFIYKWAGNGFEVSFYVALLLMCPAIIPLIQNIGIEIQRAKNKHQFRSITYFFMAVINVFISIVFAKWWGEVGAALGTAISLIIANGIIMNIFYYKVLKIDIVYFWKEIAKFIPALLVPCSYGVALNCIYKFHNLLDFCGAILLYLLIFGASLYFLGLNKMERDTIKCFLQHKNKGDKE